MPDKLSAQSRVGCRIDACAATVQSELWQEQGGHPVGKGNSLTVYQLMTIFALDLSEKSIFGVFLAAAYRLLCSFVSKIEEVVGSNRVEFTVNALQTVHFRAGLCRNAPFSPSRNRAGKVLILQAQLGGEVCWPRGRPLNRSHPRCEVKRGWRTIRAVKVSSSTSRRGLGARSLRISTGMASTRI